MEDKANVSRSVKYLEENGYLVCRTKTTKRYQGPLELTEKGLEIGARLTERISKVFRKVGEGLSDEDREAMYRALETINNNLTRFCNTDSVPFF